MQGVQYIYKVFNVHLQGVQGANGGHWDVFLGQVLNCRQLLDLHGNAACCGTWQAEEICSITSSSSFLADADADADADL